MIYSNPANLAIIACPGGKVFADEVINHLERLYRKNSKRVAADLARRYNLSSDKVIEQIQFINEIVNPQNGNKNSPKFKIPVKFVSFPNGEIKSEILESIRGKDTYIFQDVENRYPVHFSNIDGGKILTINDHLMTLFVTIDAVKQAGAQQITLVIPNYP